MIARKAITALLLFIIPCCSFPGAAQGGRRLWVLEDSGEIVEYNPSTWAVRKAVQVPAEAVRNPDGFAINRIGQMLFCPISEGESTSLPGDSAASRIWLWNGQKSVYLDRADFHKSAATGGGNVSVAQNLPRYSLSADGRNLYWFENEFQTLRNASGAELSVSTAIRAWQSDLAGRQRIRIADFALPPCKCGTGVCSESCPEAAFWFPDGGVDDFFFLTGWIPGQIGAIYESTSLFRRSAGKWSGRKLTKALENVEDAARGGVIVIYTVLDGACCGWDNWGDDQTILIADGKETVIFDEFKRFGNPDYDVSFFTSTAKLSPDLQSVAVTIVSTASPGAEIHLSDQGKPNPEVLARIRASIVSLLAVEVLRTGDPSRRSALFPNATLVGWLNDGEILVIEEGILVALNAWTGVRRNSPIKVANESLVFLR